MFFEIFCKKVFPEFFLVCFPENLRGQKKTSKVSTVDLRGLKNPEGLPK
jgi:hypothetical protein